MSLEKGKTMGMSKRHYDEIARIIKAEKHSHPRAREDITCLELALARYFKEDNMVFNWDKFVNTCRED